MSHFDPDDDELDKLEKAQQTFWRNVGGAAFVTGLLGFFALYGTEADAKRPLSIPTVLGFLIGSVIIGGLIGAAMTMKDVVAVRQRRGERVGCLLKLLFGARLVSVVVWGVIISIGTTIIVVVATRLFG